MKRISLIVLAILSLALFIVPSCSAKQEVVLGQEFQLRPGDEAVISGENTSVKFIEVTEDSRCPKGANCIWEGRVVCLLEITQNGEKSEYSIIETGANEQAERTLSGYRFTFNVTPYPELEKKIHDGDYRLILKMTRAG
jgi:hypothetical protein